MLLTSLPNEILTTIIRSITDLHDPIYRDHGTLYKLCLTCKQLNSITTPILYSVWIEKDGNSLLQLLALASTTPCLIRSIESFEVRDQRVSPDSSAHNASIWYPIYIGNHYDTEPYLDGLAPDQLEDLCKRVGIDDEDERGLLLKAIEARHWDAVITLVILSLPSLQRLNLNLRGIPERERNVSPHLVRQPGVYHWLEWGFRRAAKRQASQLSPCKDVGALAKLRDVSLEFFSIMPVGEKQMLSQLLFLLSLPSLRSFGLTKGDRIIGEIDNTNNNANDDTQAPLSFPHIKKLSVIHCPLNAPSVTCVWLLDFLPCFPCLESFRLVAQTMRRLPRFNIWHLRDCLKELTVSTSWELGVGHPALGKHTYTDSSQLGRMDVTAQHHLTGWVVGKARKLMNVSINVRTDRKWPISSLLPESVQSLVLKACERPMLENLGDVDASTDSNGLGESRLENLTLMCDSDHNGTLWVFGFNGSSEGKSEDCWCEIGNSLG